MHNPHLYWVGFNLVKGIGAVRFRNLLDFFGSAERAWLAPQDALQEAGLSPKVAHNVEQARKQLNLEQVWQRIESLGMQVLTWEDEGYPRLLKEIDQPPPVLYVKGGLALEDEWAVAIVGTRKVSPYGRQVAADVATVLAAAGVTVVSGLALGVDTIAHQAALKAGGRTLAVLGSGLDRVYPDSNRRLADEIVQRGALVSDYAPGTAPDAANFPARNRIISGLARVVLVVEAGETSGALITANFAVEQGREVFAAPGSVYSAQSKGANRLISQGATPMLSPQDVLAALNMDMVVEHKAARLALPADANEAAIYKVLTQEPLHVDEIREQAGLSIELVSATLAVMELKGMVRQVGGMNFVAVRELPAGYNIEDSAYVE